MNDRAAPRGQRTLLVLDFDGVICDSVEEGYFSSWIAYHQLYRGQKGGEPPMPAPAAFRALRPFVRSGEDFLMMQDILARSATVRSQGEFDKGWELPGIPSRETFKDLFYRVRTDLLRKDRHAWLSMSGIYPHVASTLAHVAPTVPVYVLSTKKPQFVSEILSGSGVPIPADRILYAENEPKLPIVERLRVTSGCEKAVFVEDQIDAIRANANPLIAVYLASWGYVQDAWLREPGDVTVLAPEGFAALVAEVSAA